MAVNAIYPRNIPAFTTKRNIIDDVDASDVNLLQREVHAIASVLGIDPQIAHDVSIPPVVVTAEPGDLGGLTQNYNPPRQAASSQVQVIDYGTVSARLDALERGSISSTPVVSGNHCFKLSFNPSVSAVVQNHVTDVEIAAGNNFSYTVRFPAPPEGQDPFLMFNGTGVTFRKSGFWVLEAHAKVIPARGAPPSYNVPYQSPGITEYTRVSIVRTGPSQPTVTAYTSSTGGSKFTPQSSKNEYTKVGQTLQPYASDYIEGSDSFTLSLPREIGNIPEGFAGDREMIPPEIFLKPTLSGWFRAGDSVSLFTSGNFQSVGATRLPFASLSGFMVREGLATDFGPVPTNFSNTPQVRYFDDRGVEYPDEIPQGSVYVSYPTSGPPYPKPPPPYTKYGYQ